MRFFGKRRNRLARTDSADAQIAQLIELHAAGTVIDVGANVGQYAQRLRAAGIDLPIVSIEPPASRGIPSSTDPSDSNSA